MEISANFKTANSKPYKAWLDELTTLYYSLLKKTFIYPTAFATLLRNLINLLLFMNTEISYKDLFIPILTMSLITGIIVGEKYFEKFKSVVLIMFFEYIKAICYIHYFYGITSNIKVYPLISAFITFLLEFLMLKVNKIVIILLQFSTIVAWTVIDISNLTYSAALNFASAVGLTTILLYLVFWIKIRDNILIVIFNYKQKIMKSQLNLRRIVEALPDGLIVLNPQMKVKLVNKSLKENMGIHSKQEFLANFQNLQYIDGSRTYTEGIESFIHNDILNYIQSHNIQSTTFGITKINESYYQWRGNISTWNGSESLILLVRDCTDLIELEKTKAMQIYQTAVLRSVSHELKTPTSAIISANEQILEEITDKQGNLKDKLEVINVSGSLLLNFINSLLDFVLINSGTFVLNRSSVSLKDLLEEILSLFHIQARQKKIRLTTQIDKDVPLHIKTDRQLLKQVIINLLSNAMKYTQKGKIEIRMIHKDHKLKISIVDTGIGITSRTLNRIFHLFGSQQDLGASTHGCGLKLHISNLLVNQLGGERIEVSSIEGEGSCFSFSIDTGVESGELVQSSDSTLENIPFICIPDSYSTQGFPSEAPQVLIVDDNEFNRYVISEFLKKDRIVYDVAINGLEAVMMVKIRNCSLRGYKVVIMDCQMPIMDGWEATKQIMKLMNEGIIKLVPAIIGYTAYSGSDEEMKSREVGMIDFLEKPTTRDKLMGTIRQYLV